MNFWSVFVTGLLAGGASCVVVQGGLLAGAVGRGHEAAGSAGGLRDDAVQVGGLLGVRALRRLVPPPPPAVTRFVRRSGVIDVI